LAVALTALAACGGTPTRVDRCEQLLDENVDSVPEVAPTKDEPYGNLRCTWLAPGDADRAAKLTIVVDQPVSYDEGQSRADAGLARRWKKDDVDHVTAAVPEVGTSAYRFTTITNNVVTVTVRGYLGFRELLVEYRQPYPDDGDVAALEERAVLVARSAITAS
jgi:hypothetical protein